MLLLAPSTQAQTALKELPRDMIGVWGFAAEDCKDEDSDGRVVVQPREVSSFAALFKLRTISRLADGTLRAATRRYDEGEARTPRDTLDLKLLAPDRLSIKSRDSGAVTYQRCKGGVQR
jgi:hypothetical protein